MNLTSEESQLLQEMNSLDNLRLTQNKDTQQGLEISQWQESMNPMIIILTWINLPANMIESSTHMIFRRNLNF